MRRFVIIILTILCWLIVPIHAQTYGVNGRAMNDVSQSPTMNMRSTSPYATNSYSMYYSANERMQESSCGLRAYGSMNNNINTTYCPGEVVLGVKADQTFENTTTGGPRKASPGFNDKDHYWVYDSTTGKWKCAKCGEVISAETYEEEEFGWCPVPLEFDWMVMAFLAGMAIAYMVYKTRESHRTKTSVMRT